MTTPFDRLERIASRSVDRTNAIRFVLIPQAGTGVNPNARARRSTTRDKVEGKGVFDNLPSEGGIQLGVRKTYRESNDFRALRVGSEPTLSIDRRTYFPDASKLPRQGDVVYFPDREGAPTYEVTTAQSDGHSRIILKLVQRGDQPLPDVGTP